MTPHALSDPLGRKSKDSTLISGGSPTIPDVIEVLETMVETPAEFGYATAGEQESVRSDAESLLKDLRPSFRDGGELDNLSKPSISTRRSSISISIRRRGRRDGPRRVS